MLPLFGDFYVTYLNSQCYKYRNKKDVTFKVLKERKEIFRRQGTKEGAAYARKSTRMQYVQELGELLSSGSTGYIVGKS